MLSVLRLGLGLGFRVLRLIKALRGYRICGFSLKCSRALGIYPRP